MHRNMIYIFTWYHFDFKQKQKQNKKKKNRNIMICIFTWCRFQKQKPKKKEKLREETKLNMYAIPHCVDLLCTTSDMQTSNLKKRYGLSSFPRRRSFGSGNLFSLGRKNCVTSHWRMSLREARISEVKPENDYGRVEE